MSANSSSSWWHVCALLSRGGVHRSSASAVRLQLRAVVHSLVALRMVADSAISCGLANLVPAQ
jgi:hypothetical protein